MGACETGEEGDAGGAWETAGDTLQGFAGHATFQGHGSHGGSLEQGRGVT